MKVIATWKLPGIGVGRRDYSKVVEMSTLSMMMSRQGRFISIAEGEIDPFDSLVALLPMDYACLVHNVYVSTTSFTIFDVRLHEFDLDLNWLRFLGWKVGIGSLYMQMREGIFIPGHMGRYFGIEVWNYHDVPLTFTFGSAGVYERHWT